MPAVDFSRVTLRVGIGGLPIMNSLAVSVCGS